MQLLCGSSPRTSPSLRALRFEPDYLSRYMTRAGIVTVAGKPNAGKSTLLNQLVGQKLAITSPKPQSTRDRVVGIRTAADVQMVLLDTPGLLEPEYELHHIMKATALAAVRDADLIVYLVDATLGTPPSIEEAAGLERAPRAPVLTVLNKSDALTGEARAHLHSAMPAAPFVSALTGDGIDALVATLGQLLPEHPYYYDADDLSTQQTRFFAGELVRETALEQLDQEVPYSVACVIEEFREAREPVYIRAVLHVERDSQKGILLGHQGARIREIGKAARLKIETLIGQRVYLDLWVKVLPNWRKDPKALARLGYRNPDQNPR